MSKVILLDFWASPFTVRAKIAMAEKGVEFEAREEDLLGQKSELLLKSNPIHKKVPVLIHNGKVVNESSVIVSYIDEVWPTPALLPSDPHERPTARFWSIYVDRVYETGTKIWKSKGKELEEARKEFIEILKNLEGALGEKDFFGSEGFGFVDLLLIPITSWFHAYEQFAGIKVERECPQLAAWIKRCLDKENVAKFYPNPEKVYEFICSYKKSLGIEQ